MKRFLVKGLIITFILFLLCFTFLFIKINIHKSSTADGSAPYVIILGAKVKPNGEPSLSLKYRLDTAINYLNDYPKLKVIVSGGQGLDEPEAEAIVMYDYLTTHGIKSERIMLEDQSTSTYENLLYSKELLSEDITHVTIISNDFHLARAVHLAKQFDLHADTVAAPTPKSVELKSSIRECIALAKAFIFNN